MKNKSHENFNGAEISDQYSKAKNNKDAKNYKEEVTEKHQRDEYEGVELNLDSLQAFLDKFFLESKKENI
jgi:hypothetical protein